MPNALQKITVQFALVSQTSSLTQIHTFAASSMSAFLILIVQPHWLVGMKNVSIHANVPSLLIALLETTEEYAHAFLDMKEIHMELLVPQVSRWVDYLSRIN